MNFSYCKSIILKNKLTHSISRVKTSIRHLYHPEYFTQDKKSIILLEVWECKKKFLNLHPLAGVTICLAASFFLNNTSKKA